MHSRLKNAVISSGILLSVLMAIPWAPALAKTVNSQVGLATRVQRLEDIEEIKNLKHRYVTAIDNVIANPAASQEFASLLADDFRVEYDSFGTFTDKASLQSFLENVISPAFSWGFHAAHNPRIEVNGDEATGEWYLTADAVYEGTTVTVPFYGRYVDHYVRTPNGWRIKTSILKFDSPPHP